MYGNFASIQCVRCRQFIKHVNAIKPVFNCTIKHTRTEQLIPTMARNVCIYICIVIVLRYSDSMAYVVMFIQICMRGTHRFCSIVDDAVVFLFHFV